VEVPIAAVIAAGAVLFLLLVTILWLMRARRLLGRRIVSITARLADESVELVGKGRLDRRLTDLEHVTEKAVTGLGEARLARDRLEGALASVTEAVVVCDEDGEIVFLNEPASSWIDVARAENAAWKAMTEVLRSSVGGKAQKETIELYGPPRRSLSVVATPLDDGWRTTGAVVVVDDLSSRRRVEAMRRDFVDNVNHELGQPVAGLAVLAEALAAEDDRDVGERLAARLQAEATRVARVVKDLLELSGVESEEAPLRDPVAVHSVVAQAVDRVRPLAERRSIDIQVGDISRHLAVIGDRRQLVSAVANLVDNAVRYSDERSGVQVDCLTDGAWVDLRVRDEGIGIAERELDRVFERFYRVEPARRRDADGSGLGLAIVRHVAGSHGGSVHVESTEGEGSTFTLRLPAGPGPVAVSRAEAG
jgi:two-component system sensor histidine kinase SenX3